MPQPGPERMFSEVYAESAPVWDRQRDEYLAYHASFAPEEPLAGSSFSAEEPLAGSSFSAEEPLAGSSFSAEEPLAGSSFSAEEA
jgi:hypothetical protein